MSKNQRIRVAQRGLGAMGQGVAKVILAKDGLELVSAFDISPEFAGKNVDEVLGVGPAGVKISNDPASIPDPERVDVVTITTTSWVKKQLSGLKAIISAGINVVSIAEEMVAPEAQNPEEAVELDALVKEHGVSAIGVGVDPGFMLDHLVVVLTAGNQGATSIEASRINDLSPHGQIVLSAQSVGTTPEEFKAGVADGSIVGHVGFPESVRLISDAPGLGADRVEQTFEPTIAEVPCQARDRVIEPGKVAGCNHIAVGYRGDEEIIELIHPQQVNPGVEGVDTGDYITIHDVPGISMSTGLEIVGGRATAGIAVNIIPRIFVTVPGLKRIIDLPSPTALMGLETYERR